MATGQADGFKVSDREMVWVRDKPLSLELAIRVSIELQISAQN